MNRFDYSIIAIFFFLLFGLYGAGLQPIRIFVFFLTILNGYYIYNFFSHKKHLYLLFFPISLVIYALISVLFVLGNLLNSFLACAYFILNILLFVNFVCCFEYARKPIYSVQIGCFMFSFISVLYGIYEINTGNHLSVSFLEGELLSLRDYSSFTFGNYNTFVLALMANMPILAYSIIRDNKFLIKFIALSLLLCMSYIVLTNGSRAGFFGLSLTYIYILFCTRNVWLRSLVISIFFVYLTFFISKFDFMMQRVTEVGLQDRSRSAILYDVFPFFVKEEILGFGIGNFSYYAENVLNLDLFAPHNFFLEIMFELGFVSFFIVIALFIKMFFSSFGSEKHIKFLSFYMFLLFVPFSVLNSGYLLTAIVWLFVALLYSFSVLKVV